VGSSMPMRLRMRRHLHLRRAVDLITTSRVGRRKMAKPLASLGSSQIFVRSIVNLFVEEDAL
jgi:hypothetical protein